YRELLDASHIIPDGHPHGVPEIRNGLALCKIHHTAFDRSFIGIRPDTTVEVRADILEEKDGPMLKHGLQGMHGQRLHLPTRPEHRPDREALEYRYELFRTSLALRTSGRSPDRLLRGNFGRTDQVRASTCFCRHLLNNSLIGLYAFAQRPTSRHSGLPGENRIWAHCHPYCVQFSISTGSISSPLGRDTS